MKCKVWIFKTDRYMVPNTTADTKEQCWKKIWEWHGRGTLNFLRQQKSNGWLFRDYEDRAFRDFIRRHKGKPVKVVIVDENEPGTFNMF